MSLKDLLPPGAYEEIAAEVHDDGAAIRQDTGGLLKVKCPTCGRMHVYDVKSPYRPFCSERCRLIDLGDWASEKMVIKGRSIDEDQDAELLKDPTLPKRNDPRQDF